MTDERRNSTRVDLDIPYFVWLLTESGGKHKVMLSNISHSGLQIDMPASLGSEELVGSKVISLNGFPSGLTFLNDIVARVMWVMEGRCGLQFEKKLTVTEEELLGIIEQF